MPMEPPSGAATVAPWESVLPSHLCEMLEEEYVALHGPLPIEYPDWKFTAEHIVNPLQIADRLRVATAGQAGAPSPVAPFFRHVIDRLQAIGKAEAVLDPAKSVTAASVVEPFNSLLNDKLLYIEAAELLDLRPETRELARRHFDGAEMVLREEDLQRFNRLLLEDACPTALLQIYPIRMNSIVTSLHETPRAALCLSGGGIRSGTFSLGVLQGLARRGLLGRFHYLSTVSGGGYIGGWFTAWCQRHPRRLEGVIEELRTTEGRPKLDPEPAPIKQLREYSNFLTPRFSLVSADVWSFVAIYIRNLLINWTALIPLMLSTLLVPRIAVALLYVPATTTASKLAVARVGLLVVGFLCSVVAVLYITVNRPSRADALPPGSWWRARRDQGSFLRCALLPTVVAGVCFSTFWAWYRTGLSLNAGEAARSMLVVGFAIPLWAILFGLGIAIYLFALLIAMFVLERPFRASDLWPAIITGAGGGFFAWLLVSTVFAEPAPARDTVPLMAALYGCLAVPAYLVVFFCASTVFVAFTSRRSSVGRNRQGWAIEDEDREWLGRHGGWLLIAALGWAMCSVLVVFGPILLLESPRLLTAFGGVTGLIAVLGGKSGKTAANNERRDSPGWKALLMDQILSITAVLFLAVMVAALSLLSGWAIGKIIATQLPPPTGILGFWTLDISDWTFLRGWLMVPSAWPPPAKVRQLAILYYAPVICLTGLALAAFAFGYGAARVINLNKFSLHAAYRARMIRAFLGASRTGSERSENPFTGFDPQDNIQMHELRPGLLQEASFKAAGLTKLVVKLRDSRTATAPAGKSKALYEALSPLTQKLLQNHRGDTPPSQSLKRSLIEDLNRQLDADPGLRALTPFSTDKISGHTLKLIESMWKPAAPPAMLAGITLNADAPGQLPRHRRGDAFVLLNRAILDSVYSDELEPVPYSPPPYKLLHVVGTALNLVGGTRLAWQQRRAESFTISPLHCGSLYLGYRRSRSYGGGDGISLGTAMTISGAAVNSNMGYHSSSAAVTLALTLFNARLGSWLGNPGHAGSPTISEAARRMKRSSIWRGTYLDAYPRSSIEPLRLEAFGLSDDTSPYVLLSDGGHFDNLGLYEMVLRRCRFIVAVDGSQDEKTTFEDLGAAVRKIRIDLGIDIAFETPVGIVARGDPNAKTGKYCAVATIRYSDVDKDMPDGVLLYIKPAITGDEPRDVLQYAATNPAFPHQPTIDQFFDESQFESYRRLGSHIVDCICEKDTSTSLTYDTFMLHIYKYLERPATPPPPDLSKIL